jgi:hypothetical protein
MEGIDLRDDYTFDYKNEQFEVEPIINSDENGVSNAVFTIFDGDGEEVGEVAYSREGGKQKFTANSDYFQWNNAKFEDGGYRFVSQYLDYIYDSEEIHKKQGNISEEELKEFFDGLTMDQVKAIRKFFETTPRVSLKQDVTCPKCQHLHHLDVEGLLNFFD